jgi:hypothetical protein
LLVYLSVCAVGVSSRSRCGFRAASGKQATYVRVSNQIIGRALLGWELA